MYRQGDVLLSEPESQVFVKVRSSCWSDSEGLHVKKDVRYCRRASRGCNFLEEDVSAVGAETTLSRIVNLDQIKDGIYQVIMINGKRDYETGSIDDYDFKLVPVK